MKQTILRAAVALLLAASLAACSSPSSQSSGSSSESSAGILPATSSESASSQPEQETPITGEEQAIVVADATMYRGAVSDIQTEESRVQSFTLTQQEGQNFGTASLRVTVNENTQFSFPEEELTDGLYVEVYFPEAMEAAEADGATALALNRYGEADVVLYNGTVLSVTQSEDDENSGSILVKDLGSDAEVVFFYDENTKFYLDIDALEEGDKLNILFSGVMLFSAPAQAGAMEVRAYAEPA